MVRVHTRERGRRQGVVLSSWGHHGPAVTWDVPAHGLTEAEQTALQASAVPAADPRRWRWHDVVLLVLAFAFIALVLSLPACGATARTGIAGAKSEVRDVRPVARTTVRINLPAVRSEVPR